MIPQHIIEEILQLDIAEVIGHHIELRRKGTNHVGSCPFHNEKTPSFSVSQSKGIYKCFGCGKAGNAIGFTMDFLKIDFVQAVEKIAEQFRIKLPEPDTDPESAEKYKHREALFAVNEMAAGYFREELRKDGKATEYVKSRWNDSVVDEFRIGFAPDGWDNLKGWAKERGIRQEILLEAGLLKESKGKIFDYFRNRIVFPIINRSGRICGFTGRDFSGDPEAAKYFNTSDTEIYKKSSILYGMNMAVRAMKEKGYVHLVEGNPDVIRLHQIGKLNTVGTCGTSLTADHIVELKRYTSSVTLIGDSDENRAGEKAVIRSGRMIIEAGMYCNVIMLPPWTKEEKKKHDPDSFFTGGDQFDDYAKENIRDYIIWLATIRQNKCKSPDLKTRLIDELSDLITRLPETSHQVYVDQLGALIKPRKAWQDRIRQIRSEEAEPEERKKSNIPSHILLTDWEKYAFYADGNKYFFRTKDGVFEGTNFVMEPLFHIESVLNAKRLYKITNEFNYSKVIELQQKDLISLANFKLRIESLGNFLFKGTENQLTILKAWLYEKTSSCTEITQLGWQKHGFWAWSNGIFNGSFKVTDTNGIVVYEGRNFYLPSNSDIYGNEDNLFVSERRFRYKGGQITLHDYAQKLIEVFGENAIFGICFYIACLFRDHIYRMFGFFPILNLFGPKGAGKTELAISLLQFFGHQAKGPNITNTTKAALADHVALFSNTCCHIDEYKNNLEYEKIEFLKGLWDGTGRTRMNMDKDKKKEMTSVDAGCILSGQEMPTADIALYSRLIALTFSKVEYTDQEKTNFVSLKEIEKAGLAHITHEILSYRQKFLGEYQDNYNEAAKEMNEIIGKAIIEDRIFRNWLIIIAAFRTLREMIEVPWSYRNLVITGTRLLMKQNSEIKKSNELAIFWSIVEFLANNGEIMEEVDFRIDYVTSIKTDLIKIKTEWPHPKNILLINHSRIFQLYRVHGHKSKDNILPIKTLEYYLTNSKEYMGRKMSVPFKVAVNNRIIEDQDMPPVTGNQGMQKTTRKITTAMAFDYDMIGISIHNTTETTEDNKVTSDITEEMPF